MYVVVKETGAESCLTRTGVFLTQRNAYAVCEVYNARNKNSNVCYVVKSISMEWARLWRARRAENKRRRRERKYNRLINKRNNVDKKIKKLRQGA